MLAKTQRLTRDKDFEKIFKQGKSYYSKLLGVKAIVNQRVGNRYGIIISAKVSKKAVERNRLKRQIREVVKRLDKNLNKGVDLAIMVLPVISGHDARDIEKDLEKVLGRLKLISKKHV